MGAEKISFEFRSAFGDKIAGFPVLSCAKGWHCWRDRRLAGRERPDGRHPSLRFLEFPGRIPRVRRISARPERGFGNGGWLAKVRPENCATSRPSRRGRKNRP